MTRSHTVRFGAIAVLAAAGVTLAACGGPTASTTNSNSASAPAATAKLSGTLAGGGSTAQQSAQKAWYGAFQTANSGVTVTYDGVGSGGGRTGFISGKYAFAGTDAALTTDEISQAAAQCTGGAAIDLPVYIDPIAVVFNLKGVKSINLDPTTIAKIFRGQVKTWNDPAIAADNPGVTLPSTAITPVHRSDNSGTTTNFTDYLSKAAAAVWTDKSSGDWPASLTGGQSGNGTSGLIQAVQAADGTIGYADFSQVGQLGYAKIKVGSSYVEPSAAASAKDADSSPRDTARATGDIVLKLNRATTDPTEYPLVLVSYIAACNTYSNTAKGNLVKGYLQYVTSSAGQQAASQAAGSAPLTGTLASDVIAAVNAIKVG